MAVAPVKRLSGCKNETSFILEVNHTHACSDDGHSMAERSVAISASMGCRDSDGVVGSYGSVWDMWFGCL